MDLVSLALFPRPACTHTAADLGEALIWLPRPDPSTESSSTWEEDCVPALYLPTPFARYTLLYLHENRADLGSCFSFCTKLRQQLRVSVLCVEFPGYGLCPGIPTTESVTDNARWALYFLTHVFKVPESDIIVFGRSIGTGPALAIAQGRELGGVVLVSAFTSINDCVRERAGPLADYLEERYPNLELARSVTSPLLLVHGKQDSMVDWSHSKRLFDACSSYCRLLLLEDLSHNGSLFADFRFTKAMVDFFLLPSYNFTRLPTSGLGGVLKMSAEEAASLKGYLPLEAPQGRLLRGLRSGEYLVTTACGFAMVDYRCSKDWEDRSVRAVADGAVICGEDAGEGWVLFKIGHEKHKRVWPEDSDSEESYLACEGI